MKKNIFISAILTMVFLFSACSSSPGKVDNVKISIGNSTKFTEEEIQQAVEAAKETCKDFEHCELLTLEYDEEKSNAAIEDYLHGGHGAHNGARAENIIVFDSTLRTDSQAGGAWSPNRTYPWSFILIQNDTAKRWIVDDWGAG